MTTNGALFSDHLIERYQASVAATSEQRKDIVARVMNAADLPREGTSGAANGYLLLIGSEFGAVSSSSSPHYSLEFCGRDGWNDLWRLRVGEPNPHFDQHWTHLRNSTRMWQRLFEWLPDVVADSSVAYTMFTWANLSVTPGGKELGSKSSRVIGMQRHVAPLIAASGARVVVAANERVKEQVDSWAAQAGGTLAKFDGIDAWNVTVGSRTVIAAKVGHPSLRISRHDYTRQLRTLIAAAESLA